MNKTIIVVAVIIAAVTGIITDTSTDISNQNVQKPIKIAISEWSGYAQASFLIGALI